METYSLEPSVDTCDFTMPSNPIAIASSDRRQMDKSFRPSLDPPMCFDQIRPRPTIDCTDAWSRGDLRPHSSLPTPPNDTDHFLPEVQRNDSKSRLFDPRRFAYCSLDPVEGRIWNESKEQIIRSPYEYIASQPGKEFRTLALNAFNAWLQVPPEKLAIIANVVRMLHTASLLIDDIQDSSLLRRGRPVAHRIYGVAQSINSANYYYFLALQELQKLDHHAEALEIYQSEMLRLHRGQGMELYWRDTLTCPTEDEYLEMVSNKTGGLFRLAVRLMQCQSPTDIDLIPLVQLLGLVFQIVDDYKNLADCDYTQLKGVCEDLTEGKFSFPVIHSIRSEPNDGQLLSILAQKSTDIDIKMAAVDYMRSTGSFEYTEVVVDKLITRAKQVADSIDQGRGRSYGIYTLLDKLTLLKH